MNLLGPTNLVFIWTVKEGVQIKGQTSGCTDAALDPESAALHLQGDCGLLTGLPPAPSPRVSSFSSLGWGMLHQEYPPLRLWASSEGVQ